MNDERKHFGKLNPQAEGPDINDSHLLSPMNDLVFKALFGREEDESRLMLMDLLNAVIYGNDNQDSIKEITHINPFNLQEHQTDKLSVLDIKVKTAKGIRINVEIQVNNDDNFRKRSLYYWSKLYGEAISQSEPYEVLKQGIIINIIDFNLLQETGSYHSCFQIMERHKHFLLLEDLEIHYLELCKYASPQDEIESKGIPLWLTFLKEAGSKTGAAYLKKLAERSEVIKMALQNLEKISADEAIRYKYLEREMARRDEISRLHYAETKGMEKGMEKGKENAMVKVAKAMLAEGEAMEKIMRYTGLTREELEKL